MEYLRQYEVLLKKAKNDFLAAELIYKSKENIDIEIALFHLQQAVEKSLKALLIYNKIEAPRTHNLDLLIKLIKKNNLKLEIKDEILDLNDYAVDARYNYLSDSFENFKEISKEVEDIIRKVEVEINYK
ncbi:MAG: hypothetical protein PWP46_1797 [Fusobacteriaceae bacterium]|jgi:HEPN domain-containing protein|nr:hypothetical protein [Fusobacteriales bacterium]MDN5304911.1 hypothetical protein [Fusobacteriaceae bacterium]